MPIKLRVSWSAPAPEIQAIEQEIRLTINGTLNAPIPLAPTAASYDITSPAGTYKAEVRTKNVVGYGPWSLQGNGPAAPPQPETPTITTVNE